MTQEQQRLAVKALHKLALELGRGTASPRFEYDEAIRELDAMKAIVPDWCNS